MITSTRLRLVVGVLAAVLVWTISSGCGASGESAQSAPDSAPTQPPTSAASSAPPSTSPATSPPTAAASVSGVATFEVGDDVELSDCTPVVPPSQSSTMTLLRLACPELPDNIQFADVSVASTDVDIPSMSTQVDVEGQVVDIVKSGAGFTTVVIAAERIETG